MNPTLLHLIYDSPDNPWCGGGGAMRDYQILSMLSNWRRTVCSGYHGRGSAAPSGTSRIDLGIGLFGEFVSRRTWAWSASRFLHQKLRADSRLVASHSVSPWAPVRSSLLHPGRILHVVHHVAGESILKRLGPFGPASYRHEKQILSVGRFFATSNRATAARIRAVNPDARISIIPNGFTRPQTRLPPERAGGTGPTIAFLGRMDHQMKGLDRLLAAFEIVGKSAPDARLLIAGRADASMRSWLARAMKPLSTRNRISVVENPDDERKYALLDGADIFCVPSRFEGWCIAAIEAQSCGLPVVATRTDGLMDSVLDGETGVLVSNEESESVMALSAELLSLVQDEPRRKALGANALKWASRFTWEAAARATSDLLEEIRAGR